MFRQMFKLYVYLYLLHLLYIIKIVSVSCQNLRTTKSPTFKSNLKYKGICSDYTAFGGILPKSSDYNPFFSYDHIMTFIHTGRQAPGGLTDMDIGYIANHANFVTLTKFENIYGVPSELSQENKMTETALRIKKINKDMPILFYLNSVSNFRNYNISCSLKNLAYKGTLLHMPTQTPVISVECPNAAHSNLIITGHVPRTPIYDFTDKNTVDTIISFTKRIRDMGIFNGIFLDLGQNTPAKMSHNEPLWNSLSTSKRTQWSAGHISIMKEIGSVFDKGIVVVNNMNLATMNGQKLGRLYEQFMFFDFNGLSMYDVIIDYINAAKSGRLVEANAKPCGPDLYNGTVNMLSIGPTSIITVAAKYIRSITISGFLIGLNKYSYFSCSGGFVSDKPKSLQTCWHEEYNKDLGEPIGPAKHTQVGSKQLFYRSFQNKNGIVNTYLVINSKITKYEGSACTCWSDGSELCSSESINCSAMKQIFKF